MSGPFIERGERREVDLDHLVEEAPRVGGRPRGRQRGRRRPPRPARPRAPGPSLGGTRRLRRRRGRSRSSRRSRRPCCRSSPCRCALIVLAPGPKYSTMAPVPPETPRRPATSKMTSFGDVQPESSPVRCTPISFGQRRLKASPGHDVDGIPPPTPTATMPRPPAFGVWLSVPIIIPPGKA